MRVKAGSCGHCSAGNGLNNRQNHSPGCVTHLTGPGQLLETAGATGSATSQKGTEASSAAIATKQQSQPNSHCGETGITAKQPSRPNSHCGEQPSLRTAMPARPRPQDNQDPRTAQTSGQPQPQLINS